MWLSTIFPSIFAYPIIALGQILTTGVYFLEMLVELGALPFHRGPSSKFYTLDNWYAYPLRRFYTNIIITLFHFPAQFIPIINWVLNSFIIACYWYNAYY